VSAKRVTVSISDELAEQAAIWQDDYSPSELYQKALKEFVQKKEQLAEQVKGEPDMEQIIERLKKEKRVAEGNFHAVGKDMGLAWARNAEYSVLKYAAEAFKPNGIPTWDEYSRFPGCSFDAAIHYKVAFEGPFVYKEDAQKFEKRIHSVKLFGDNILGKYFRRIASSECYKNRPDLNPFVPDSIQIPCVPELIESVDVGDFPIDDSGRECCVIEGFITPNGENFLEGWLEAVKAFWKEVSTHLNA